MMNVPPPTCVSTACASMKMAASSASASLALHSHLMDATAPVCMIYIVQTQTSELWQGSNRFAVLTDLGFSEILQTSFWPHLCTVVFQTSGFFWNIPNVRLSTVQKNIDRFILEPVLRDFVWKLQALLSFHCSHAITQTAQVHIPNITHGNISMTRFLFPVSCELAVGSSPFPFSLFLLLWWQELFIEKVKRRTSHVDCLSWV